MIAGALSFLGAFLLFLLQPLVAKHLTPWFGGGSQVWLSCMVFFQGLVLAGYGYAHVLLRQASPGRQARLHLGLVGLACASLLWTWRLSGTPLLAPAAWMPTAGAAPSLAILGLLAGSVGGCAFLLSANATLTQAWLLRVYGRTPYGLYALSNAGSLLGLLAYPFLLEPFLPLRAQAWTASGLVLLYAGVMAAFLGRVRRLDPQPLPPARRASWRPAWVLISLASSVLLMAVTNLATTELSGVPLLWVLPLVLYLLTFILAFSGRWDLDRTRAQALLLGLFAAALAVLPATLAFPGLLRHLAALMAALFAGSLFCHARLYALRPEPERLSGFYLAIALGGVLGGLFVGVAAPNLFHRFLEFPLAVLLVGSGVVAGWPTASTRRRVIQGAAWAVCALAALAWTRDQYSPLDQAHRDAYGMVKVATLAQGRVRLLMHGRTVHGLERLDHPELPLAYYAPASGIGRALASARGRHPALRIGVLGLGVGNVLAYAQPGDHVVVYELSPKIIRLAGPEGTAFDLVRRCRGTCEVKAGDGRLLLARETAPPFDVLLVDAFSGGNFPPSLATLEALHLYAQRLAPDGLLVINATNRLPLDRLLLSQARAAGLGALAIATPSPENPAVLTPFHKASSFVVLARDPARLLEPALLGAAQMAFLPGARVEGTDARAREARRRLDAGEAAARAFRPWTDDWNCLSILALSALRQRGDV